MSKFKKGDRVTCYGTNQTASIKFDAKGKRGEIVAFFAELNAYNVRIDGGDIHTFHSKQLRKLVKPQIIEFEAVWDYKGYPRDPHTGLCPDERLSTIMGTGALTRVRIKVLK